MYITVQELRVTWPPDWCLELSDQNEIWQAGLQHSRGTARQISARSNNSNQQSRGFKILSKAHRQPVLGPMICHSSLDNVDQNFAMSAAE